MALVTMVAAAGYAGFRWWNYTRTWVSTDNAYISGHIHMVSTRVAGTVTDVLVAENQEVEAGALLARLDANDLNVQREKALAAAALASAQRDQARAQAMRDEAIADNAQLDFNRANSLIQDAPSAISKQEFDKAKAALSAARGALAATRASVAAAEAQVDAARAQVKEVELQLSYTEIVAPVAGRVGRKNLEAGNRVQPGQALLAIVQPRFWVTANFKETQLARLHPGQPVTLSLDSLPGRKFSGRVESIAPASGSQFALLPPDNATGNFTKIVQRVPVKIVFDGESVGASAQRIVPGMSVVVNVKVRS
jgi:membrane fusion protein (multidrug efflux system)